MSPAEPFARANVHSPDTARATAVVTRPAAGAVAVPDEPGLIDTYAAMPASSKIALSSWALTLLVAGSNAPGEIALALFAASAAATGVALIAGRRS
ncbi:MAG: hypothetical protein ACAI38_23945 [Myxococcota bacterium]|nr:hypothetical protein [Myxococcota bacterium]